MLTILEKLAALVLAILKGYRDQTDRELRRRFALECSSAYFRLLDVTETAHRIFGFLYALCRVETEESYARTSLQLKRALLEQASNLRHLEDILLAMQFRAAVFPAEFIDLLQHPSESKAKIISWLIRLLEGGYAPTLVTESGLLSETASGIYGPLFLCRTDEWIKTWPTRDLSPPQVAAGLRDPVVRTTISTFLDEESPEDRLVALHNCAEQLRQFMIDRFSIEEVLWSADEYARRRSKEGRRHHQ
jgi:hypothetical protein